VPNIFLKKKTGFTIEIAKKTSLKKTGFTIEK